MIALENWRSNLHTVRSRFETLNERHPNLYAVHRSWPREDAHLLDKFLKGFSRFEEIQFEQFCLKKHEFSWLMPVHAWKTELSGVYILRSGARVELILLYGSHDGWHRFHQICTELKNLIAKAVRGFGWPFGEKPGFVDMSTWARTVFEACYGGKIPSCILNRSYARDDKEKVRFFQSRAIQLVAVSAQAMTPLLLAAEHASYPGPKKEKWATGFVNLNDNLSSESRLIWQPLKTTES